MRHLVCAAVLLTACSNATHDRLPLEDPADTPAIRVGERLFREPRFSQLYFARSAGNANALVAGDPVLDELPRDGAMLPNPFKGQTMSCVSCHMVDEATRVT